MQASCGSYDCSIPIPENQTLMLTIELVEINCIQIISLNACQKFHKIEPIEVKLPLSHSKHAHGHLIRPE